MFNHYNPNLRKNAITLRNSSVSIAEKKLWKLLLSRQQSGVKFKRQRPIDWYIVDFFSSELSLIVEIDGSSHLTKGCCDKYREDRLQSLGYHIIRFQEAEVLNEFQEVRGRLIYAIHCLKNTSP